MCRRAAADCRRRLPPPTDAPTHTRGPAPTALTSSEVGAVGAGPYFALGGSMCYAPPPTAAADEREREGPPPPSLLPLGNGGGGGGPLFCVWIIDAPTRRCEPNGPTNELSAVPPAGTRLL